MWISVKDRLPDCMYVLLSGVSRDGIVWRDVGVYRGDGDFRDKYGADSHPTHWMPLPEPPTAVPFIFVG